MTNRDLLFLFSCAAICFCSLASCKKESIDNGDNGYPIELTAETQGRNVILTWTETKTTEFEKYIVVRSATPIPDDPTPLAQSIANIDEYKTASFEDKFVPITEYNYYKVYVKIGDRFLFSPTVKVANEIKLLTIQPSRVLFDTKHDRVFLFDGNRNKLYRYNYATQTIEDSLYFAGAFDIRMALGNHGGGDELYLSPNNLSTIVKIYNPDNFEAIATINVGGGVLAIASGNNGFLYISTDNWQKSFTVYKRSTKQLVDSDDALSGLGDGNLKVLSLDGFSVVNTAFNQIVRYDINSQGVITNSDFSFIQNNFVGLMQSIVASNDLQFFCMDMAGNIMDRDLEIFSTLSNAEFFFFTDMVFSNGDSQIFGITTNAELIEFGFPNISVLNRAPLNYFPVRIDHDEDKILIVGSVFDNLGNSKTIVDKLDID